MSFPDIQIISIDPVTKAVSFGIQPVLISGITKLVQIVVLSLMDSPGKDVLNPLRGSGLPAMIGAPFDPDNLNELFGAVAQAVKSTEKEILTNQIGLSETPEELLQSIQVLNISEGATIDDVMVTLRVINQAGRTADIVL